jgi:iron complex outermembrane receptor protein
LHVKGTYTSVTGKQQNGNYLPFIPAQKFRYEVRIKREKLGFLKNPSVQIAALSALKQNKPSPYETATEGYTLVNLSLYSEVQISQQTFIFSISANNIFDTQYFDHLSTLKPLNYLNEGRNFSVSMKIPFAIK